jgi:hypothetical protein
MYLTQFFYINSNEEKVFCYHKFCIHPKKTKVYKRLSKFMNDEENIIGIGYQYNVETKGLTVTYKKLK